MWQAGDERRTIAHCAGFTLMEVLAVVAVLAASAALVSVNYRGASSEMQAKTAAMAIAARLREVRTAAITTGTEREIAIDVAEKVISYGGDRAATRLGPAVTLAAVGAAGEQRTRTRAGLRFFPNGSSTGATISIRYDRSIHEVRVNWLTGRVSTNVVR